MTLEPNHYKEIDQLDDVVQLILVGDWESVVRVRFEKVESVTQRWLALFHSIAYFQLGSVEQAELALQEAETLGANESLIEWSFIVGMEFSFGRLDLIVGKLEASKKHFFQALDMLSGDSATSESCTEAFFLTELGRLGLNDSPSLSGQPSLGWKDDYQVLKNYYLRTGDLSSSKIPKVEKKEYLSNPVSVCNIIVAGMRHAGSTALFNVIRLALEKSGIEFEAGYAEGGLTRQTRISAVRLFKVHEIRDDLLQTNSIVVTTTRDLRDSVASAVRRDFPLCKKMGGPVGYARYNRSLSDVWGGRSDHNFHYEEFIHNPHVEIKKLIAVLGLTSLTSTDIFEIQSAVTALPTDKYDVTLLSDQHITDPSHTLTYRDTLKDDDVEQITSQNSQWFLEHGYI